MRLLNAIAAAALDLLPRREKRVVIRGPASLENPAWTIAEALDAEESVETEAGLYVDAAVARAYAPWIRGINLVSNSVARLKPRIHRNLERGGSERDRRHPGDRVLRLPNRRMSAFVFRKTLQAWAMGHGNAYAYILRDDRGRPIELIPIHPSRCRPVMSEGELWYSIRVDAETRAAPAADVLHIRGLSSSDGILGDDVIKQARLTIGLGKAAEIYGARYFGRGARPSTVITHPLQLGPEAKRRIKETFDRTAAGLRNSHASIVLDEGMKLEAVGHSNENAEFVLSQQFNVRQVANHLGVPPHKLGDDSRSSYNSLEQESQAYLDDGVEPWLCTWEEECDLKLLTQQELEEETRYVRFNRRALVRVDIGSRSQSYQSGIQAGWYLRSEAREAEDLPYVEGLDEPLEPENMRPAGSYGASASAAALRGFFGRLGHRIGQRALARARRGGAAYMDCLGRLEEEHGAIYQDQGGPLFVLSGRYLEARSYFARVRERLLEAAECPAESLVERVAAAAEELAEALPETLVQELKENEP